jgi:Excalibur calcium-binding domain
MRQLAIAAVSAFALFFVAPAASIPSETTDAPTTAKAPKLYQNCTNLNRKYPHGLGRANARDKTSDDPVTNFKRSTKLYRVAMSHNKGLDRDKDGIACEQP